MQTEIKTITRDSTDYPPNIELSLGEDSPATISMIGNEDILSNRKLALFCSSKCPGSVILKTYDLTQKLRAQGRTMISGFHSPMEKECLDILLRSSNPVIICPARGLGKMRIREEWKRPISENRLLILSPFPPEMKRGTAKDAQYRNLFVAALTDEILIAHAAKGSKLNNLAQKIASWGKPLFTLQGDANKNLTKLGYKPVRLNAG